MILKKMSDKWSYCTDGVKNGQNRATIGSREAKRVRFNVFDKKIVVLWSKFHSKDIKRKLVWLGGENMNVCLDY